MTQKTIHGRSKKLANTYVKVDKLSKNGQFLKCFQGFLNLNLTKKGRKMSVFVRVDNCNYRFNIPMGRTFDILLRANYLKPIRMDKVDMKKIYCFGAMRKVKLHRFEDQGEVYEV